MNDLRRTFLKTGFVIGLVVLFLTAGMVFCLANSPVQAAHAAAPVELPPQSTPEPPSAAEAPNVGPQLWIATDIPASPNSIVDVPVHFSANGNNISSIIFSVDYEQSWLQFDSSVPMSITMNLPSPFVGSCSPNVADVNAEINCFVSHPGPVPQPLTDRVLATIKLRTLNPPVNLSARAGFSSTKPASFGSTAGQSVTGSTVDGSVYIDVGCPGCTSHFAYIPLVINNVYWGPGPTPTPTPTPTPPPSGCQNLILNGDFESNTAWEFPITEWTAWYSTLYWLSPSRSARTGIDPATTNRYSYSSVRQLVTIPINAYKVKLRYNYYPISSELYYGKELDPESLPKFTRVGEPFGSEPLYQDLMYIVATDQYGNYLGTIASWLSNSQTWIYGVCGLMGNCGDYRGQTIMIEFGTYNDGWGGVSAMYVDDVELEVCVP
jgi:hypothetical protein